MARKTERVRQTIGALTEARNSVKSLWDVIDKLTTDRADAAEEAASEALDLEDDDEELRIITELVEQAETVRSRLQDLLSARAERAGQAARDELTLGDEDTMLLAERMGDLETAIEAAEELLDELD